MMASTIPASNRPGTATLLLFGLLPSELRPSETEEVPMGERKRLHESDPMSLGLEGLFLLQGLRVSELVQVNEILAGRCRTYTTLSAELRKQLDTTAEHVQQLNAVLRQELSRELPKL
jgi:hypothetical protein